jgi:hypothetical protein
LYPNPTGTDGAATLEFRTVDAHDASIEVRDLAGRVVAQPLAASRLTPGLQRIDMSTAGWSAGVYMVTVNLDGNRATERLIVE